MTDEPQTPETPLSVDPAPDAETPSNGTSLGGRVRRTTQTFTFAQSKSDDADEFSPPVGKGVKVRDIEFVRNNVEALGKKQQDMVKQLYSIMFGRRFQQKNAKVIKEHILDFSGIIEQDEKSREHLIAKMGKWKLIFVHEVMDLLAVDRSKKSFDEEKKPHNKEALLDRLVDWLYNPQETKVAEKKAAIAEKKEKQKAKKRAKKAEGTKSGPAKKKRKTTKKKTAVVDEKEEEDHEATESEGDESSSDFEEAKKPSKKRKVTRRPKKSAVVESDNEDDDGEKDQATAKPEEESNAAAKEEPKTETEALDADVCSKVRDIIAKGDAEELTVKKIVRQLSADMGRDMSAQKKAIKEFITNDQAEI